jgi:GNAT superfamily N-acetyltransferase
VPRSTCRPRLGSTPHDALRGPRVRLRQLGSGDIVSLAPWCRDSNDLRRHLEEAGAEPDVGLLARIRPGDERTIGILAYKVGDPGDGWLGFDCVAVEPGARGLRLESQAVRLVEESAKAWGLARRFWAGVKRKDGPGLYFWLRLGYRVAQAQEKAWLVHSARRMMAMVRTPGGGT